MIVVWNMAKQQVQLSHRIISVHGLELASSTLQLRVVRHNKWSPDGP